MKRDEAIKSPALNTYRLEWGHCFRTVEQVQGTSEHAVRQELMVTRPEIFPVQIELERGEMNEEAAS